MQRDHHDVDIQETEEWIQSLDEIVRHEGRERGQFIIRKLIQRAHELGIRLPFNANTPYVNTIPSSRIWPSVASR